MVVNGQLHTPQPHYSQSEPHVSFGYEGGWASEAVWML
jgi:hypothetical protein